MPHIATMLRTSPAIPLAAVHDMKGAALKKVHSDYEEGKTDETTLNGMESLRTEFTFTKSALWGKKDMAGLRMSAIASDRRISVLCIYPKALQGTLQPIYMKMLATFKYTQV